MGLEIGFDIYKKEKDDKGKPFLKKVEFPKEKEDDSWSCGRCEVNYSWGYGYKANIKEINQVTFDKELDNYAMPQTKEAEEYGFTPVVLHYVPYDEYKKHVEDSIDETIKEGFDAKRFLLSQIYDNNKEIAELRELQKKCSSDNEFAFDKWTEEIKDLKRENINFQNEIDHYDEEDYDVSHANRLRRLLQYLEECQKEGYTCIPWYSD